MKEDKGKKRGRKVNALFYSITIVCGLATLLTPIIINIILGYNLLDSGCQVIDGNPKLLEEFLSTSCWSIKCMAVGGMVATAIIYIFMLYFYKNELWSK